MEKQTLDFCKELIDILEEDTTLDRNVAKSCILLLRLVNKAQDDEQFLRELFIGIFMNLSVCLLLKDIFIKKIKETNSVEIDWIYSLLRMSIKAIVTLN